MVVESIATALSKSASSGSRSTALQPLLYLNGISFVAFLACMKLAAGYEWVCVAIFLLSVVIVIFTLCAYWHFAKTNPDSLRSERFTLRKLELGMVGDSESGLRKLGQTERRGLAPSDSVEDGSSK